MDNYLRKAKNINLNVYTSEKYLQSYKINKEHNYVELHFMSGFDEMQSLDEVSVEELNARQRQDLEDLKGLIYPKADFEIKFNGIVAALYYAAGITLNLLRHGSAGIFWLSFAGNYVYKFARPLKLKRNMELASWIYDNREKVDEVIKEEVNKKTNKPEITAETINMPKYEYPTELVPYSENMYESGINLSNIDELSNRDLRKLKRKVLSIERKKR